MPIVVTLLLLGLFVLMAHHGHADRTGYIICAIVCIFGSSILGCYRRQRVYNAQDKQELNKLIYTLAGYIASGSDSIGEYQQKFLDKSFTELKFTPEKREACLDQFYIGAEDDFDPLETCYQILHYLRFNEPAKLRCLEFLITIIYLNGILTSEEYDRIIEVSHHLHIDEAITKKLLRQAAAMHEFKWRSNPDFNDLGEKVQNAHDDNEEYNQQYRQQREQQEQQQREQQEEKTQYRGVL